MTTSGWNAAVDNSNYGFTMAPPILTNIYGYSRKYALGFWQALTSLSKSKQDPALYVSLSRQDKQAKIVSQRLTIMKWY